LVSGSLAFGYPQRTVELKTAGDDWEVAGHVSTFGNRDLGNDIVHRGAFADALTSGSTVRFLFAHDPAQVIGRPLELYEDEKGLFGRFKISRTRLGQDVHQLLVDGCVDSFSIGFIAKEHDFDEKSRIRNLRKVELLEASLVALPMQPAARVTSVKDQDYATLPLEELLEQYETHRTAALGQAKAVAGRRLAEGRRLSDPALATLERLRALAEEDAAELLRLATTPPARKEEDDPAPVRTAGHEGLVEAHLRRARLRDLGRIYGVKAA